MSKAKDLSELGGVIVTDGSNVGIGTSSPDARLSIVDGTSSDQLRMGSSTSYYKIGRNTSTGLLEFSGTQSGFNGYVFGGANGERMRIDSSGNVLVDGTTTPSASGGAYVALRGGNNNCIETRRSSTNNRSHLVFFNPNGVVGNIATSGSSTLYNTSSDYRLKEDLQPMTGAMERVKALNPVNFAWKSDGSRVDGFLAHEAQSVVPEAVSGEKDAMRDEEYEVTPAVLDDDGNVVTEAVMGTRSVPDYQGIDQAKLVPLLTAALQEAITKIENLEARLATLETN